MIALDLDPTTEERLRQLAASEGVDLPAFVRRVLADHLQFQAWPADSEEQWADTSVALTPEVMPSESWSEGPADGSR